MEWQGLEVFLSRWFGEQDDETECMGQPGSPTPMDVWVQEEKKCHTPEETAAVFGGLAVSVAKTLGFELDFSKESVASLEKLLDFIYMDLKKTCLAQQQMDWMTNLFGCYLGESMLGNGLKEAGYYWARQEDETLFLKKDEKNQIFPINKVFKQLTNGPEDGVNSFFKIGLMIAEGKFPASK